jgi:uncharacterized protein (DUF362 family)
MARPDRRHFLKTTALAGGALAATDPLALIRHALAAEPPASMAIARWQESALASADLTAAATQLTEAAIAAMGGMGRFVNEGDVVWVKPNIGWNRRPELAANTNPDVVGALVRLCREAGAKEVKVGDHTCHPAKQAYRTSGIAAATEANGGRAVYLDKRRFQDMTLDGERLKTWPIYAEIAEADLVINVPVVKHHGLTDASVAMKNYMGVIGGQRNAWHQHMDACLADITAFMQPTVTVIDAVRVLEDHGPQGGDPDDVTVRGIVAAGTDIVALDAFGVELLGHAPASISNVAHAAERGLGTMDYRALSPAEIVLS